MGNKASSSKCSDNSSMDHSESGPNTPMAMGDMIPNNGLIFNDLFIPEEIVALILSFIDCITLKQTCQNVCVTWRNLTKEAYKLKAFRQYPLIKRWKKVSPVPVAAFVYENIVSCNAFDKNILKNNSGQFGLKHWNIVRNGGDRWTTETPPVGVLTPVNAVEEYSPSSCFVTSYQLCSKEQTVNLYNIGISTRLMDEIQPDITVSELYASRFDCATKYLLRVELLTHKKETVKEFEYSENLLAGVKSWKKVSHTFKNYGPGVKFVAFQHEGKDGQFWAGHYGTKMAEATVTLSMASLFKPPSETNHESESSDSLITP